MVGTLDNSFPSSNDTLFGSFPFQCTELLIHETFFIHDNTSYGAGEGLAQKPIDFAVRIFGC